MRSIYLMTGLFIVFLFAEKSANAQQFHGGITAGIVGSQVAGDTYSGFDKAGIFGGGYVNLDVSEQSAFQLELTYFQKGSRVNPDSTNNYDQYLFRINYIEMPLLYLFKIDRFIIEAGPSMGILMGYFEEADYQRLDDLDSYRYNKPANITFQWNIGMKYFISEKLGAGIRTNNSLWNIRSRKVNGDVWRFWGYGQFSDALVLSVFYQFR